MDDFPELTQQIAYLYKYSLFIQYLSSTRTSFTGVWHVFATCFKRPVKQIISG